mmetsp:Transcript_19600/g.32133  ORF Transcript_19600/g.32133 Transcript_19600/m.32133 type:complete len:241 (+) Transcript_19600:23-745(+)
MSSISLVTKSMVSAKFTVSLLAIANLPAPANTPLRILVADPDEYDETYLTTGAAPAPPTESMTFHSDEASPSLSIKVFDVNADQSTKPPPLQKLHLNLTELLAKPGQVDTRWWTDPSGGPAALLATIKTELTEDATRGHHGYPPAPYPSGGVPGYPPPYNPSAPPPAYYPPQAPPQAYNSPYPPAYPPPSYMSPMPMYGGPAAYHGGHNKVNKKLKKAHKQKHNSYGYKSWSGSYSWSRS